mgnify:CR=1 FL=1
MTFSKVVTNDHFCHFDNLIQTMKGLYIVFETIGGLYTKTVNHRGENVNLPFSF